MPETNLETKYKEAREAIKDKDYNRATELLKQILVIDENYKDASRLLADLVKAKRRRWYNDIRLWGAVFGMIFVGLLIWIFPKLSGKTNFNIATITVFPTKTPITLEITQPTIAPTIIPSAIPTIKPSPTPVPLMWKRIAIQQELPRDIITAIVVDPGDPDVIYVGTENAGIYKSIDGGISWRPIHKGLWHASIRSLVIDPLDSKILLAAASPLSGIYKTTDGGENWQTADKGIRVDSGNASLLLMDPSNNQHLYFSTERNLYASTDQGGYWTLVKSVDVCPKQIWTSNSLVVDPLDGDTLYASHWDISQGCTAGVYKSVDGGMTWAFTGLQGEMIGWIFAEHNSRGDNFLYADQFRLDNYSNFHTSSDGGNTWQHSTHNCSGMTIHPQGGVMAYCDRALMKTMDGGQTWETISKTNLRDANALVILSNNPNVIFNGGPDGLYVSPDGGINWNELTSGLPAGHFEIKTHPGLNSIIYAFPWHDWDQSSNYPLYRSEDDGRNWKLLTKDGRGLFFDADGKTIYRDGKFLQRSTDNGITWKSFPLPYSENDWGLNRTITNPIQKGLLYYVRTDGNISRSTDGGTTWKDFSHLETKWNVTQSSLSFDGEGTPIYIIPYTHSYHSSDGGNTWSLCGEGVWSSRSNSRTVIDPRDSGNILVAQLGGGVLGSRDGCASWQSMNKGLGSMNVYPLAIDPNNPDTVYAGADGGAFVSNDFGQTWREINNGLLGATVIYSIVVDDDSNVYASTPYGIFKLESK